MNDTKRLEEILPQQQVPIHLVIKEIERCYDQAIRAINQKTWLEKIIDAL